MIAYALLGLLLGPVLNLVIDRLPHRRPILVGAGRCGACGLRLGRWDLLPILGWLRRRGRCRHCGSVAPLRVLLVEVLLPLACAALRWRDGWGTALIAHTLVVVFFVAIVCIDLEHRIVPNRLTGPGLLAALGGALFGAGPSPGLAALGAVVGLGFLLVPFLLLPGLGLGDVKLAAVIGALVGYPDVLTALVAGIACGGIAAGFLLVTRRVRRRDTIAYAPYLVLGALMVLFGWIGGGSG